MKEKVYTFTLPESLVNKLLDISHEKNISKAILDGIAYALADLHGSHLDSFSLHQLLTIDKRRQTKPYSVRYDETLERVLGYYKLDGLTNSNIVTFLLANYLLTYVSIKDQEKQNNFLSVPEDYKSNQDLHLLRIMGSKWNRVMQDAIQHILDTTDKHWNTSIDVCAGALGIFSNFSFAKNEIINDIDLRKINTYKGIQKDFQKITLAMYALLPDKETFDTLKKELEKTDKQLLASCGKKIIIPGIVFYLYLNLLSARNARTTYDKKNDETYRNYLKAIPLLHERLKETKIYNMDILELIEKNKNAQNTIFIVDPPYLNTNVYKNDILTLQNREFGYKEHVKLAKLLRQITKEGKNNDFIYFCRITATRKKNQKTKKTTNLASLPAEDRHMEGMIDDLYWGHGFYYIDIPYGTDGTIERIITSFKFDDAKEYGKRKKDANGNQEEDVNGKRGEDVK